MSGKKQLGTLEVKVGQSVTGRYKRAGRDATNLSIEVEAIASVDGTVYLIGTRLDQVAADRQLVLAAAFDPREVAVVDVEGFDSDFDPTAWTIGGQRASFRYLEAVNPHDVEWVALTGGYHLPDILVESASIFALVDA